MRVDHTASNVQDRNVELVRDNVKRRWGVHLCYTKAEAGLFLVVEEVEEDSPAWRGGLRRTDCIISIHGWIITRMDKPEVTLLRFPHFE